MDGEVSDEQLWSWIDRAAPDLDAWLERNPGDAARVARLRGLVSGVRSETRAEILGIPERIGAFAITGFLGAGGMGIVYAGRQEAPARDVAIKVLKDSADRSPERERFFAREIEALGRLNHPGIAAIHVSGITPTGERWFAMERVHGTPLHRVLREKQLTRMERVKLVLAATEAVAHAHDLGIVHRDIKPSNVMVTKDGAVKVLDFGLAKLVDEHAAPAPPATQTGALLGTLPYLAPELARDGAHAATAASDVWSLGVVLFEALTGVLPIVARDDSLPAAIEAVRDARTRSARSIDPSIERDLAAVLATALAPVVSRRYRDAGAFAADLRRHLAGEPVLAHAWSPVDKAGWWLRRHRRGAAAACAVVAIACFGTIAAWAFWPGLGYFAAQVDLKGDGGVERAPWDAVEWIDGYVLVRLDDGNFVRLVSVDGEPVELLLGVAKRNDPRLWQKRFEEDFDTLFEQVAGRKLGSTATLRVAPRIDGAAPYDVRNVPVTRAKRLAVWQANQEVSPAAPDPPP